MERGCAQPHDVIDAPDPCGPGPDQDGGAFQCQDGREGYLNYLRSLYPAQATRVTVSVQGRRACGHAHVALQGEVVWLCLAIPARAGHRISQGSGRRRRVWRCKVRRMTNTEY